MNRTTMHTLPTLIRAAALAGASAALAACGGHHDHDSGDGAGHHDEGHAHVAPNGGTLVELGDHFANVEFLHDGETGSLTMFTLGGHAEKSVRCPNETVLVTLDTHGDSTFDVTLAAQESKLAGETVGDSSKFVGQHDELKGVDHFHGVIRSVSLMDTEFTDVEFDVPGDDEDDHAHDGDGHDDDHGHGDSDEG